MSRRQIATNTFATQLLEQLATPAFAIDEAGVVIFWNKACERLTNISSNDVIGTKDHWKAFYEFPRPCLADLILEARTDEVSTLYAEQVWLDQDRNSLHCENWCPLPLSGQRLYLGIDAGPVYDEVGNLVAVVETLRNMTSHKVRQAALQNLAALDALTGLANRRRFDEALQESWIQAMARREPISLLMIDIDHFKFYNDTYGHQEGDRCIRAVADVISEHIYRGSDIPARYGGEEFAIILAATPIDGATLVAERIRATLRGARSADEVPPAALGNISVSIGVSACIPTLAAQIAGFVGCADAALYQAKRCGRNRVCNISYEYQSQSAAWRTGVAIPA